MNNDLQSIKTVLFDGTIDYRHPETNELHREEGPAVEYPSGTKVWYLNGQPHRVGGPAAEYPDGTKYWYLNGQIHRTDGPAMEHADGTKYWFLNGKEVTKDEFERWYLIVHLREYDE